MVSSAFFGGWIMHLVPQIIKLSQLSLIAALLQGGVAHSQSVLPQTATCARFLGSQDKEEILSFKYRHYDLNSDGKDRTGGIDEHLILRLNPSKLDNNGNGYLFGSLQNGQSKSPISIEIRGEHIMFAYDLIDGNRKYEVLAGDGWCEDSVKGEMRPVWYPTGSLTTSYEWNLSR
ncbi:hypothetical protein [Novosphingobium sp.]|uniref:hypothetical protein n=1 Tax=Novosphingobium sp. TaxID=1874826 RepID=UPI0025DC527C|nr:hypothetical protein [Novosphingobium sp.]